MPPALKSKVAAVTLSPANIKEINALLRVINVSATRLLVHYKARKNDAISNEDRELLILLIEQLDTLHRIFFRYLRDLKSKSYSKNPSFLDIEPSILLLNEMWVNVKNMKEINLQVIGSFSSLVNRIRQIVFESMPRIGQNLWN